MEVWLPLLLGIAVVAVVVLDATARQRGQTDSRWRRFGAALHAVITVVVVGLLTAIAVVILILWVFRPIGGP